MKSSFNSRLNRLTVSIPGDPVYVFSDKPISDEERDARVRNWREEVSSGRASRSGEAIYLLSPRIRSIEEWEEKYCDGPAR
jgi:hypothetical protein